MAHEDAPALPDTPGDTKTTRVTARRAQTRQRLLNAALEVFAKNGFGRSTIEQVCDQAGYSRGAFYSNFTSLDELFLALWEQRSARMLAELRAAAAEIPDLGPAKAVRVMLDAIPVDDEWYRVSSEFTAHALRTPALRRVVAAREQSIQDALLPILVGALTRAGRQVPDEGALWRAVLAAYDGTATQILLEPAGPMARYEREELFLHLLEAYSTPSTKDTQ